MGSITGLAKLYFTFAIKVRDSIKVDFSLKPLKKQTIKKKHFTSRCFVMNSQLRFQWLWLNPVNYFLYVFVVMNDAPDFVLISRHVNVRGRAQPQGERLSRRPHFMKEARARSVCLMTSSPRLGSPAEDAVDSIGCRLLLWEGLLQSHFSLASPPLMYTSLIPWVIFLSIHGSPKTTLCYCSETALPRGFQCLEMWCLCMSILLNRVLSFPWVVKWGVEGELKQTAYPKYSTLLGV